MTRQKKVRNESAQTPNGSKVEKRINIFAWLRKSVAAQGTPADTAPQKPQILQKTSQERRSSIAHLHAAQRAELSGIFYYEAALRFWSIMFASLVLDAGVLWYGQKFPHLQPFSAVIDALAIAFMAVCLVSIKRERLLDIVDNMRSLQGKVIQSGRTSTVLIVLFVGVTLFDIVIKAGSAGLVPLLVTLAFVAIGVPSLVRNFKEKLRKNLEMKSDLPVWVAYVNRQTMWINVVPLACARLIALAGVFRSMLAPGDSFLWLPFVCASLGFLLVLKPEKGHFVIHCPRCAAWCARALKTKGFCAACEPQKFLRPIEQDAATGTGPQL